MQQLIDQITKLRTPLALNQFINGKTVSIKRDNDSADVAHRGKEVSLKIYDRLEIKAGKSRYQIVEQPLFKCRDDTETETIDTPAVEEMVEEPIVDSAVEAVVEEGAEMATEVAE